MIWLKIAMAAVMSGSLFAVVETVLPPRPPQPFTIQVSDWAGDQVFALIEPLGIDTGPLIHLDIRRVAPGRDPVDAFRAGVVDAVLIELSRLPELMSDEVRVLYVFDEVSGGSLVGGPGVRSAADVQGHSLGVTYGNAIPMLTFSLLDRLGIIPQDIAPVALAPGAAEAALRSGRVAAVATLSPSLSGSLQRIPGTSLLATTQDSAGSPGGFAASAHVFVVREGKIPEQREHLDAVLRAVDGAVRACRLAMDHCLELMAAATGRPAAEWRRDFEAVHLLDLADNRVLLKGGNAAPVAQRLMAFQTRFRRGTPSLSAAIEWIDPTVVEGAARP